MRTRSRSTGLFLWITFLFLCNIITISAARTDLNKETTTCITNLCDVDSPGLRCPQYSSIHIHRMYCSDGDTECPWNRYLSLYSLCEGSNRCDASGLRELLNSSCQTRDDRKRNVLVDYFCVPNEQFYDTCSKANYKRVAGDFGIIRSPKTFGMLATSSSQCKWWIPSVREQTNKIVVHLVFSVRKTPRCDGKFLRIMYMDCDSKKSVTRAYCNLESVRDELVSCGPVKVLGSVKTGQSGSFIISYQSNIKSDANIIPSTKLVKCLPLPVLSRDTTTKIATKSEAQGTSREGDKIKTSSIFDPKFLFLYIGLGVLILVLLTALIVVIIRYQRLPSSKHGNGDSSERISLWHQNDDTPLDTFGHNGLVEPTGTFETANGIKPGHTSDQVIATVHQNPPTDSEDFDPRLSTTSGISTFLSDKRDSGFKDLIKSLQTGSFGVYSTMQDNHDRPNGTYSTMEENHDRPNGTYDTMHDNHDKPNDTSWHDYYELSENGTNSDIYQSVDHDLHLYPNELNRSPNFLNYGMESPNHMVAHPEQQPLVSPGNHSSDDYHYCINDDEYALVRKSRKPPRSENTSNAHHMQPSRPDNWPYQGDTVDFRPASGPYEKRNGHKNDLPDSATRWSKGKQWVDEV